MKGFWKDFKAFISKGNIVDLAIAVVIGGAFGKIVTSLVNDVIMPLISLATGGVSVSDWKWVITPASEGVAESALYYGAFIQTILDFLIIAFFIFLAIRILQKSKSKLDKISSELKKDIKKKKKLFRKNKKNKAVEDIEVVESISAIDIKDNDKLTSNEEQSKEIITETESVEENNVSQEEKPKETQEDLLREIRDLLKSKQ